MFNYSWTFTFLVGVLTFKYVSAQNYDEIPPPHTVSPPAVVAMTLSSCYGEGYWSDEGPLEGNNQPNGQFYYCSGSGTTALVTNWFKCRMSTTPPSAPVQMKFYNEDKRCHAPF